MQRYPSFRFMVPLSGSGNAPYEGPEDTYITLMTMVVVAMVIMMMVVVVRVVMRMVVMVIMTMTMMMMMMMMMITAPGLRPCSFIHYGDLYSTPYAYYKTMNCVVCFGDCLIFAKCIIFCVHWLPACQAHILTVVNKSHIYYLKPIIRQCIVWSALATASCLLIVLVKCISSGLPRGEHIRGANEFSITIRY